jgi:hypothetical protein
MESAVRSGRAAADALLASGVPATRALEVVRG